MKIDFNNKLLLKILSCIAAIVLWVGITYTEDPIISQSLQGIQIVFDGEDELENRGLIVTNKESLPDISVAVRGSRSNVIASMSAVKAVADVSGITSAGSNMISVKYNYPTSLVTLIKTKTQEITVETEKIVARNIPIRFATENQDKNTQFMVKASTSEETIKIRGAESKVYKIAYAMAPVDVSAVTKNGVQQYVYKFYDDDGDEISEENIIYKSTETVYIETEVYTRKTVPIKAVLSPELSEEYELKSIGTQTVDIGVLEGVEIEELYVTVSSAETDEKLMLTIPEGVYVPEKSREVSINYELEPKVLEEIEVEIEAINVPEGKTVKIEPEKLKVSVKGAKSLISSGKITAQIDASKINQTTVLPISITAPEHIEVIGSYGVTASIE